MPSSNSFQPAGRIALRSLLTAMSVAGAICVSTVRPAFALDAEAPGFHFLAADPSLRGQLTNTSVVMGQAAFVGKVLELNQPWESPFMMTFPGSVVTDPVTGEWRMYYELMRLGHESERLAAMATSNDGVTWTKLNLNITGTDYTTDHRNNFVKGAEMWICGPSVFIDPTDRAEPYHMVENPGRSPHTMWADVSADGLHWRHAAAIIPAAVPWHDLDSQNTAFWDPKTKQYIAYMRRWFPAEGPPQVQIPSAMRRSVFLRRSGTFGTANWTGPLEDAIDPKLVATIGPSPIGPDSSHPYPIKPDIYCSSAMPYHGQYIGIPSMYCHTDRNPGTTGAGPLYPTFMYSRDSSNWTFPDPDHPIINLAAHGKTKHTFGSAYASSSLPEKDGYLYIYYTYFPVQHKDEYTTSQKCLAKLREDRFVGIKSARGNTGGVWTTSVIKLSSNPGRLLVNAVVGGSVRVEVLDPSTGLPIPGYSAAKALAIAPGDFLAAAAGWQGIGDLNALTGRTVGLRFMMDDATIYSFRFESVRRTVR